MNPFSGYGSHGKRRGCFPTRPYQYMKLNEAECRYVAKNARHVVTTKVWPPLAAQAIWRTLIEGVQIYGNGNSRLVAMPRGGKHSRQSWGRMGFPRDPDARFDGV
jgi:hypothetical protein